MHSRDRRELEQEALGGPQAVTESETINEMSLTTPYDQQATERSYTIATSQSARPRFVAL